MLIGELVHRSGLSKDTIRFYEKKGLIAIGNKSRRENNYKEYSEQVLDKLALIKRMKELGFTLNEIDAFLQLWQEEDASCKNLRYILEQKIKLAEDQMHKLLEIKVRLISSLTKCNDDNCEFEKTIPTCICGN
jgi:DNA-binding transcriptional MerR regulator